jgi:uncharacterized delta-60 repeat protein
MGWDRRVVLGTLAALVLSAPAGASAAPGDVDAAFGSGGFVAGPDGTLSAIAIDHQGRIVVAGAAPQGAGAIVGRRMADGSPDPSFGDGGQATLQAGPGIDALAVAADDSVVVLGRAAGGGFLARLTPTGALDPGFGDGGIVRLDPRAAPRDVAIAQDGAILVAVQLVARPTGTAAVARFTPTGQLDGSWAQGGIAATRFGATFDGAGTADAGPLVVLPDGSFVLGGSARQPGVPALARFTSAGVPDAGFGDGGAMVLPTTGAPVTDLAARPDGSILVLAGGVVAHVSATGTLDRDFGVAGGTLLDLSPFRNAASALAAAPDGSVVVVGASDDTPPLMYIVPQDGPPYRGATQVTPPPAPAEQAGAIVARLTPSGAYDCSFGSFGRTVLRRPGSLLSSITAVAIDGDGRALAAGFEGVATAHPSQLIERTLGGPLATPVPTAPLAYTRPIEGSATGGRLDGFVDPRCADTRTWIEYGPTTAYGSATPVETLPGAGGPHTVRPVVSGLAPGLYHYRVVAENATGRVTGEDASFEVPQPVLLPSVRLLDRRATARGGRVALRFACAKQAPCGGSLLLTVGTRRAGTKRFSIGAGRTQRVAVALRPAVWRMLRRHRALLVRVRVSLYRARLTDAGNVRIRYANRARTRRHRR